MQDRCEKQKRKEDERKEDKRSRMMLKDENNCDGSWRYSCFRRDRTHQDSKGS
jgi:hypothetical protein